MDTSARDGPLAGLVSLEAEALYAQLLRDGRLEVDPAGVDLSAPMLELLEARVAYRPAYQTDELKPTTQATALQLLLSQQHRDIASRQEQVAAGWRLLDSVLTATVDPSGTATGKQTDDLAEVISGRDRINQLAYELQQSVQHELLGLNTGVFTSPMAEELLITPPSFAVNAGKSFRVIYDTDYASNKAGAHVIEASVAAGESARIRANLPLKMLHVDDRIALVALTATGMEGSLLVRSPHLLAALREWFELLWNDPVTTPVHEPTRVKLPAAQRQVLRLMSSGMSDEAIARASNASVRTVRRHIAAILDQLGVNSRFAAGAMAAKRGWI